MTSLLVCQPTRRCRATKFLEKEKDTFPAGGDCAGDAVCGDQGEGTGRGFKFQRGERGEGKRWDAERLRGIDN
jgi:hypothetical protein